MASLRIQDFLWAEARKQKSMGEFSVSSDLVPFTFSFLPGPSVPTGGSGNQPKLLSGVVAVQGAEMAQLA